MGKLDGKVMRSGRKIMRKRGKNYQESRGKMG